MHKEITFNTEGESLYEITNQIKEALSDILDNTENKSQSGLLTIFTPHTSCGLTISEAYEVSAKKDVENFLKHIAPRNLAFITHTTEGADDSPSHMKSILLQTSLNLIVDQNTLLLGTWQGIFLAEFRDLPKVRKIIMKFIPSP